MSETDIDLEEIRRKYQQERDKRIRAEGTAQYTEVADALAGFYETDPYSTPIVRDAISEDLDVAVLGGGFAGLIIGARLKQAGVADLRIIEMGGDFGGTWYWNRYPGVQCDVESYTYMPLLEELKYVPRDRYASGPEIHQHCRRIGEHFGLYGRALFGTIVRAIRWDDATKRWRVTTNRGDELRARFVVMASGVLNKPKLPGIPGIQTFKGKSFHTARWDFDYTGGDTQGGLVKLADKRVALIGTGASGIQVAPYLGRYAQHLYVFQRTPSSISERGNRPTNPEWAASLEPGWTSKRHRAFQQAVFEGFGSIDDDIIQDAWGEISRNVVRRVQALDRPPTAEERERIQEVEDAKLMQALRNRVDAIVQDKATAEALKPYYRFMCKRPCFNDDYLPTFNRPTVTLVDVSGRNGIERITETGLIAGDVEYEVDCIIYASGFEVTHDHRRRFGIPVIDGRNGLSLYDHWREGLRTWHGLMAHGFPNQFFTGFTQNAVTAAHNLIYEQQARQIAHIVSETLARGFETAEPTPVAEEAWVQTIHRHLLVSTQFSAACTPGYYTNEGAGNRLSPLFGEPFGLGLTAFQQLLDEWRTSNDLEGLELGE
jgi:cyclohexanone monooxygenase